MSVSPERQQDIVNFLASLPNMHNQSGRQAFVYSAGLGQEVESQLEFGGSTADFCQLLVRKLATYNKLPDGRNALAPLLEAAKSSIGQPGKGQCERWIRELNTASDNRKKREKNPPLRPSESITQKITEIERLYEQAYYHEAYQRFHQLCAPYPKFKEQAVSIVTRLNDLNNQIIEGTMSQEQQTIARQQIGSAFKLCLKQFKEFIFS